jgi:hypothetical protein
MSPIETGTWEHLRELGVWHFDTAQEDDRDSHRVIAHIDADLASIRSSIPNGTAKSLKNSMVHRAGGDSYFDRVQQGNEVDAKSMGLASNLEYADVFDAKGIKGPIEVEKLVATLPLTGTYWKFHTQRPGQVWPIHFDNYHAMRGRIDPGQEWADPGVRRMWVMFTDWSWGQFIQIGNTVWSHWRRGDVLYFDWLVPHGSANCGHDVRESLVVTGSPTPDLSDWIASDVPRVIRL